MDLSRRDEPTDEEIKTAAGRIKKKFYRSLEQVTDQILDLALRAEKEDVRLRASSRILDELSDRGKPNLMQPVSVQILNAIPMDRAPVIEGKEGKSVEWEGAKIGVPKNLRRISGSDSPVQSRGASYRGDKIQPGDVSSVGFTPDPVAVTVPDLPPRDKVGK